MGTSIPNRKNEIGSPPGPVKEYTLPPEEVAKIIGQPIARSHKKPIDIRPNPNPKEAHEAMAKLKKEDYLALRAAGYSRNKAAQKMGTTLASIEKYWLAKKWGIKDEASEEVEIALFKHQSGLGKSDQPEEEKSEPSEVKEEAPAADPSLQQEEPPAQPESNKSEKTEIPHLPVSLMAPQCDALKAVLTAKAPHEIVLLHAQTLLHVQAEWKGELSPLNDLPMNVLIEALYYGYEIERSPEELLLQEFEKASARYGEAAAVAFRTGLQMAAEIFGHKVVGVNA
ncbi:hypothetical protein JJQ72_06520 [Paenibacillus sp. F411]|uniref:hypothetical protein n=1 Tax=Paenibacillus sp. F411 TaxID=2820239 RepID=UPI001AB01102|nr:hypothetical protein [Paenibacillus sp. F411]MBO2943632.1 hypothetical protein [Paenibacillus sp. F411]